MNSRVYSLLYTLTLSSSGAPDGLKPYLVSKIPGWLGDGEPIGNVPLAVSADESTTAYVTMACVADYTNPKDVETIGVIRNGAVRKWTISLSANPAYLSLSADGGELGFVARPQVSSPRALGSAWVLPTGAAQGDATSHARRVFTDVTTKALQPDGEALSPDGKTMYILNTTHDSHDGWLGLGALRLLDRDRGAAAHAAHLEKRRQRIPVPDDGWRQGPGLGPSPGPDPGGGPGDGSDHAIYPAPGQRQRSICRHRLVTVRRRPSAPGGALGRSRSTCVDGPGLAGATGVDIGDGA